MSEWVLGVCVCVCPFFFFFDCFLSERHCKISPVAAIVKLFLLSMR